MNSEVYKIVRNAGEDAGVFTEEGNGNPDVPLAELGMDSLDAVELIMAIEEAAEVDLYDFELTSKTTLADITDLLEKELRAKGDL